MGVPRYWVNTASLNLVIEDTDFYYKGLGPGIQMTRSYDSNNYAGGMFGRGWTFSFDSSVKTNLCDDRLKNIIVKRGSGAAVMFSTDSTAFKCPDGGVIAPPSSVATTPKFPPGNRDKLTWYKGETGQKNYWIYEDKKTLYQYRYEALAAYASPAPDTGTWRLTSIADRNGNTVNLAYNADETIKSVTDAVGRITEFRYDAQRRCIAMKLPNTKETQYVYDAAGFLVKTVDLMGHEVSYAYDVDGYSTAITLGDKTTSITYNGAMTPKRVTSITDAEGVIQNYQWSAFNNSSSDAHGNRSYYPSNNAGQTSEAEDPLSNKIQQGFTDGLLTSYTDALGQNTTMEYDSRGNRTRKVLPGNRISTYTYDVNDNLVSMVDGEGKTWRYEYDARHNLTKLQRPSGQSTLLAYDAKGQLLTSTDAQGAVHTFAYDSFGNLLSVTDPLGSIQRWTFDAFGIERLSEIDPLGSTTTYTYDHNRRQTSATFADGSVRRWSYDCCTLTGVTDEKGNRTTIQANRVLNPVRVTDPLGFQTVYQYDDRNALVKITDARNLSTRITRDTLNRPSATLTPKGNSTAMTYDANWNPLSITNELGKKYTFIYTDGLPTSITDPLNATTYTDWDKNKRLSRWVNARTGGVQHNYTPDGQIASTDTLNPASTLAAYSYDPVGRMKDHTDASGKTSYAYDTAGRLLTITWPNGHAVNFSYDVAGNPLSIVYPGGVSAAYTYDKKNRIADASWGGGKITYSYDPAGNLLQESRTNGTVSNYTYNRRNQFVGIAHTKGTEVIARIQYSRDQVGNIKSETREAPVGPTLTPSTSSATYNSTGQITQWGGNSYSYDADGNLVSIQSGVLFAAQYDQLNRLISMTVNGAKTDYSYDGLGNRISIKTGSATVNYHFDPAGRLLFETDAGKAVKAIYFYKGRKLAGMWSTASGYLFYHFDHLGNTVALTDSTGNVIAAYAYTPYGGIAAGSGSAYNPFTFVGAFGVMQEGNGIYFMRHRYYDSKTGRFLQKDPIGFAGGINLYTYVGNNPVNRIDPVGTSDDEEYDGSEDAGFSYEGDGLEPALWSDWMVTTFHYFGLNTFCSSDDQQNAQTQALVREMAGWQEGQNGAKWITLQGMQNAVGVITWDITQTRAFHRESAATLQTLAYLEWH